MSRIVCLAVVIAVAGAGVGVGVLMAACKSPGAKPKDDGRTLFDAEIQKGREFCATYVTRVCDCAQANPALTDECNDAKSRPDGYEMVLKVLGGSEGDISKTERAQLEAAARKVVSACVAADGQLDPKICPRGK